MRGNGTSDFRTGTAIDRDGAVLGLPPLVIPAVRSGRQAAQQQRLQVAHSDKTPAGYAGGRRTSYKNDQLPVRAELWSLWW